MPNGASLRFRNRSLLCFTTRILDWAKVTLCFLPVLAGLLYSALAHAQAIKPREGRVVDSSGQGIANARLSVRSSDGHELVVFSTGASGEFSIVAPAGSATLVATAAGFTQKSLALSSAADSELSIELAPAAMTQVVNVTSEGSDIAPQDENTASRLNIPLASLPQSVSIVTNQLMLEQGVTKTSEALRNVAGVSLANSYSGTYEYLSLRGFTSESDRQLLSRRRPLRHVVGS